MNTATDPCRGVVAPVVTAAIDHARSNCGAHVFQILIKCLAVPDRDGGGGIASASVAVRTIVDDGTPRHRFDSWLAGYSWGPRSC